MFKIYAKSLSEIVNRKKSLFYSGLGEFVYKGRKIKGEIKMHRKM
jgi:hypothetical protein